MRKAILSAMFAGAAALSFGATLFVEAEGFRSFGGWVTDQQFMDQMGSPFLMAHGAGVPVADAETRVAVPEAGEYRVLARTRNWTGAWTQKDAAGRFCIKLNGRALPKTLGAGSAAWTWQEAGTVRLPKGEATLALHDLTGFDGRCDAVVLTTDPAFVPPSEVKALDAYRRRVGAIAPAAEPVVRNDLVIVGGGLAGTCAAISAARQGVSVTLIQDRPLLGGCNSSEVRVSAGGVVNCEPYRHLGSLVYEIIPVKRDNALPAKEYDDARKLRITRAEKNIRLFLNTHVTDVRMKDGKIAAVVGRDILTNRETVFEGTLFADCTGDGTVGFLAGADFRYGRESKDETREKLAPKTADRQTMGTSVLWYAKTGKKGENRPFPDIAWACPFFNEKNVQRTLKSMWYWETGMNRDQIEEAEYIRDYGLYMLYSNWNFLKNRARNRAAYAPHALDWVCYIAGKRESRRLMGDLVLTQQDICTPVIYPDAAVTGTWTIDLHYPLESHVKAFKGEPFLSVAKHLRAKPYPVPYRCFYSRNIPNLFMAGRNISVTHVALGRTRVQRTTGMMGEVVGMAAAICKKNGCLPRDVYARYLDELKARMSKPIGKPREKPYPIR